MRSKAKAGLAMALALALTFFGWRMFYVAPAPHSTTIAVTRGDVESIVLTSGIILPIQQVDVGTRVSGQLKALKAGLGDHVHAGELLAEIDPLLPESELRAAQANFANLEAQRRSAQARSRRSKLEFDRQRGMLKGFATSRRDLESAEAQAFEDDANLAALDAQVAQAKSQIDIASANLAYTKITAPIDGEVVAVMTREGQTVVATQVAPVILKLAKIDAMTVRAQISEADVVNVKVGQPASFTIMSDPDRRLSGTLRAVELAPQNYSESSPSPGGQQVANTASGGAVFYNALFDASNAERILRIGMTAQVSIVTGVERGVLTIPALVLRDQDSDGRYNLRVLTTGGKADARKVRIGLNNHLVAEVKEGLGDGDSILVDADDGSLVRPPQGTRP